MWIYWVLFLWPAAMALTAAGARSSALSTKWSIWSLAIILTLVIGLRFEVGWYWGNYLEHLYFAEDAAWIEVLERGDYAYWTLNWIAGRSGAGIWLVNLVCAIAFVSGYFAFCRRLPNPWLALTVGIPYMAIVMAMNYTRQGAAFGLVLWGLVALQDGRIRRFIVFVMLAALFHKSAAILIPLGVLASIRNRIWVFIWVGIASAVAYWVFIAEWQESLLEAYLAEQLASEGALIRVLMNAVAAIVFLAMRDRFDMKLSERRFWSWLSIVVLFFLPALWIAPSSTAVDRIALYFMPIQLLAFSHICALSGSTLVRHVATLSVVAGYGIIQYVWFNYSYFYSAWLPYRFYPFEVL